MSFDRLKSVVPPLMNTARASLSEVCEYFQFSHQFEFYSNFSITWYTSHPFFPPITFSAPVDSNRNVQIVKGAAMYIRDLQHESRAIDDAWRDALLENYRLRNQPVPPELLNAPSSAVPLAVQRCVILWNVS